jgi:hypothetical protein
VHGALNPFVCWEAGLTAEPQGVEPHRAFRGAGSEVLTREPCSPYLVVSLIVDSKTALLLESYGISWVFFEVPCVFLLWGSWSVLGFKDVNNPSFCPALPFWHKTIVLINMLLLDFS